MTNQNDDSGSPFRSLFKTNTKPFAIKLRRDDISSEGRERTYSNENLELTDLQPGNIHDKYENLSE